MTDAGHAESMTAAVCPTAGDELEKVGVFSEMGAERVAFDEKLARNSIDHQGFYRFEAKSFNPVAEAPAAMP